MGALMQFQKKGSIYYNKVNKVVKDFKCLDINDYKIQGYKKISALKNIWILKKR